MKIQSGDKIIELSFDEMKFLGIDYVRHLISEMTVTNPMNTQKENSIKVEPEIKTKNKDEKKKKPIVESESESEDESCCNSDSDDENDNQKINKCVKNVFEEKNNVSRAHLENPFKKK